MGGVFSKGYLPQLPSGTLIKLGIIGLENSGKTTLLNKFIDASAKKQIRSVLVSTGLSIESMLFKGWEIFIGDLLYPNYITKYKPYLLGCDVIIFMVDSSDPHQISEAKSQIDLLIAEDCISSSVFLVMANKQDQKRSVTPQQLENYLELYRLTIPWKCISSSILNSNIVGVEDSIKWILDNTEVRKIYT
ncbi:hypothetical protein DICPUDRAFT_150230 [Dictyostelium purpureum]|uniref:ADP-ribosylation factor-related protein n=1 Tax=Dictyostelium purpureum TaxID=5786 RepID=F0ZFS9_DICPU|nr:uncharacterized protein DICPUDRAFT_150230 [Dictyostelium purpureum]EGC37208.1 hypothetical protein DICPUDRAFT_150230 [Dictyostelium purpureum]|eukprot:XP_003286259.1 hypothetical protein DICPUDRAFT_150230 [Dictyostelium purpureum]